MIYKLWVLILTFRYFTGTEGEGEGYNNRSMTYGSFFNCMIQLPDPTRLMVGRVWTPHPLEMKCKEWNRPLM